MEIIFLGTGAGMPTKQRNVTSVVLELLQERGVYWLFDSGEATQHQILRTPVKIGKAEKLFLTHLHGDHLFGLPGLLTSRSYLGGETDFTVYGPKGVRSFIDNALSVSGAHLTYRLEVVELETEGVVFDDSRFRVVTRRLEHRIECFGYRIEELDLPGTLDAEKLRLAGVPPGPLYRDIQQGRPVTLADGRVLQPAEYVGPARKGRTVAILGDTRYCANAVELARNADVLVHEATFAERHQSRADEYDHSTSIDAARVAAEARAKALIMTHLSSRYQEEDVQQLLSEAKRTIGHAYVAEDFFTYPVMRMMKPLD